MPPSADDKAAQTDEHKSKDATQQNEKMTTPPNPSGGKKEPQSEELSEEDQKLKEVLSMLVERLHEPDSSLYVSVLDAIKDYIKTSTSSVTAIPKPLKFLRPHYDSLEKLYEKWPPGEARSSLADTLSVLGMTYLDDKRRDTLKYRLLCPSQNLGSWGHEYMRHLGLEIGEEYQERLNAEKSTEDLSELALALVPFFLQHNAEADAVDILSELEMIEQVTQFLDEKNYSRVCLYIVSMVPLLPYPDNDRFLRTVYGIYRQYKQYPQAMTLAIRLHDRDLIHEAFNCSNDRSMRRQMAFMIARQRIVMELSPEDIEADPELADCLDNTKLSEHFKALGKELNVLEPRTPEDIYKTHLESSRTAGLTNTDSARHNLASAFVNAFINAGFGYDKLMLVQDSKTSWVWKTKDDGMLSTTASIGMLALWDVEMGLDNIDPYTYVSEVWIRAGAALATGLIVSGVKLDSDPAFALLQEGATTQQTNVHFRVTSIIGLGLAYTGSNNQAVLQLLKDQIQDTDCDMKTSALSALALGLVFVGSANSDISEVIIQTFLDSDRQPQLKDKWTRFMALGLALLYFGHQEEVDVILETLKAIDHPMSKPSSILADVCAWAGTGNVLKIQQLLHLCNEQIEDDDRNKGDKLLQAYAVIGLSLVAMGEDVGQEMILRQLGHLMHYGEANIRRAVPLALGLITPSNPQMKVYETLSRYSHDNDNDVAINAIFAMGLVGAGTTNARLAQLLRQLASYYHRDANALFMVRIAQGLLHMGKGTLSVNPLHSDRQVLSRVAAAGLLTVLVALIDAKHFILSDSHYLLYFLVTAMYPRFLVTLDEDLKPLTVNVRVGQAVDVVGQAGRPKTITGWQTQSTPVLLAYGERAEMEDEEYVPLNSTLEGIVILRKNTE